MRMRLKGINQVKKRLASGKTVTYYYAWKGGPRLEGELGSKEFAASYNAAIACDRPKKTKSLADLADQFQDSQEFDGLRDRTKKDYSGLIRFILVKFGDFPLKALDERGARSEFLAWRDQLAKASKRQADYAWTVLARILSWGVDRELINTNPCAKAGRLYKATRADKIWLAEHEKAFLAVAGPRMSLAFHLALWTGQREGDLIRLPWSAYDGTWIKLRQSKNGVPIKVKVAAPLKLLLDKTKRQGPLILTNAYGRPWSEGTFTQAWRRTRDDAKIKDLHFHDLRGTAVLRYFMAGATVPEVAAITGHSLRAAQDILDRNYFHRDSTLTENAVIKAEDWLGKRA